MGVSLPSPAPVVRRHTPRGNLLGMRSHGSIVTVDRFAPTVDWRDCRQVPLTPLLRHASEAFYDQGFHGASVRDIAGRAGVTVPALYYHHENKEAILVAVLEAMTVDLLPCGQAAIADGHRDPVREVANLVECLVLHFTVRPMLAGLDAEHRYLGPEARTHYGEIRRANELLLRGVVTRGIDQGVFRVEDPAEATRALLGMVTAVGRWYDASGSLSPQQVAHRYVDLSLALLGVAPAVN
jgi:AcrR family transcriptional regulator